MRCDGPLAELADEDFLRVMLACRDFDEQTFLSFHQHQRELAISGERRRDVVLVTAGTQFGTPKWS
jgi:hypothetical protein